MKDDSKVVDLSAADGQHASLNKDDIGKEMFKTPSTLTIFFAEVLGMAILMFLGCMGTCVPKIIDVPVVPHFGGIGFGLTVLIVIQTVGHISGAHLNPQVTLAAYVLGKIKLNLVPVYWIAEFLGAVLGFGLLKLVLPWQYEGGLCETLPDRNVTVVQALIIEIAITCTLILVCGAVWDPRNADKADSVPLRFGFIIACLSIVAGSLSGASMNSARSFAPAVLNPNWNYHWIYWVGPTIGAIIGSVIYKYILA